VRQYFKNAYHCHFTKNKVAIWLIAKAEMKDVSEDQGTLGCTLQVWIYRLTQQSFL
jgi:hypothetical protein